VLPIALLGATGKAEFMGEWMDAGSLADLLDSSGIQPAVTARVARSVLASGAAAVAAMGPGAFPGWDAATVVARALHEGFDAGLTRKQVAMRLAEAAGVQQVAKESVA
jgi:hypothetical protein